MKHPSKFTGVSATILRIGTASNARAFDQTTPGTKPRAARAPVGSNLRRRARPWRRPQPATSAHRAAPARRPRARRGRRRPSRRPRCSGRRLARRHALGPASSDEASPRRAPSINSVGEESEHRRRVPMRPPNEWRPGNSLGEVADPPGWTRRILVTNMLRRRQTEAAHAMIAGPIRTSAGPAPALGPGVGPPFPPRPGPRRHADPPGGSVPHRPV